MLVQKSTVGLVVPVFLAFSASALAQEAPAPLPSINPVVNKIVERLLGEGMNTYDAKAGAGVIMNAKTGEIVASVSLRRDPTDTYNRVTDGIYTISSVSKLTTIAMGLESEKIKMGSSVNARYPLQIGRFTIHDYHAPNRNLTVSEAFLYSSNIAAARIGLKIGSRYQQLFLNAMGQKDAINNGVTLGGLPIYPRKSDPFSNATVAFGQSVMLTPLHAVSAVATLTSADGRVVAPTFVTEKKPQGTQVVSPETSEKVRDLLRLNADIGSARSVDIPGYNVGGMTSTADKIKNGKFTPNEVITTFIAAVPYNAPKFIFLTLLDEPKATEATKGFYTAAWNAAPVTAAILKEVAPILGLIGK